MNIAFIGLGKMGTAMVERLLRAGYSVTVYNRTAEKMTSLLEKGALSSHSISEAVKKADVVMSCLLHDEAILNASDELLANIRLGAVHIGLSTILPDTAKILAQKHQQAGVHYFSAVVLGVPAVVREGALTTFFSGNDSEIELVTPLLETFSKEVIFLGPQIFAPNVMKICMNYSLVTAIELISELYTFAEKSGIDTEIVRMGLHQIYGHPGFKRYIDKIHARNFDEVNFDMVGGNKDVSIFQEAFSQVAVVPGLANLAKPRFTSALEKQMQKKDWSAIYEIIRSEAGLS